MHAASSTAITISSSRLVCSSDYLRTFCFDIETLDSRRYGPTNVKSPLCGKQVQITNTKNGKTVTATIEDACPTCANSNSIDLSHRTFLEIATEAEGMVPSMF